MLNYQQYVSKSLGENLKVLSFYFTDCPDIIIKQVTLKDGKTGCFVFLRNFIDTNLLQRDFIRPLMVMDYSQLSKKDVVEHIFTTYNSIIYDTNKLVSSVLEGKIAFLADGVDFALICDLPEIENRAVSEPDSEKNVRGPREGFIESLDTNISMLRRRVKNSRLKFRTATLGSITNQKLAIAYIEGIVNPEIVEILYSKIINLNIDGAVCSGHIEQLIADSKNSLFPQYIATERTDKSTASLLEGKALVLLDGSPLALIAPINFFSLFQSPDDYNIHWIVASFIRFLRYSSFIITLILPGLYISITAFQYYLIPLNILVPLGKSRSNVAFPPAVEALLMEFTIQMLREASIRLPTYIGNTIGVVGGIIIGQAAVAAGIVSNLFIIVVGIMAIASYVTPNYGLGLSITIVRITILIMSSLFGMVGMIVCFTVLLMHLLSLESLGQPYFSPIMPFSRQWLKDTLFRLPFHSKNKDKTEMINGTGGYNHE